MATSSYPAVSFLWLVEFESPVSKPINLPLGEKHVRFMSPSRVTKLGTLHIYIYIYNEGPQPKSKSISCRPAQKGLKVPRYYSLWKQRCKDNVFYSKATDLNKNILLQAFLCFSLNHVTNVCILRRCLQNTRGCHDFREVASITQELIEKVFLIKNNYTSIDPR